MKSIQIPFALLIVISIFAIGQNSYYKQCLPDRVATHFDMRGQPDDWMDRSQATWMMLGLQLLVPAFVLLTGLISSRLPDSAINLPRREYWLHSDRRAATLAYLASTLAWIATIVALFLMGLNHLTFVANQNVEPLRLGWFGLMIASFLAGIAFFAGKTIWHFQRPAK